MLQCSNPDSMLWKLHQKAKFRLFRHNDLRQLGFQNDKKDKNFDFMGPSRFSGITGNAKNYLKDGKFHESDEILN